MPNTYEYNEFEINLVESMRCIEVIKYFLVCDQHTSISPSLNTASTPKIRSISILQLSDLSSSSPNQLPSWVSFKNGPQTFQASKTNFSPILFNLFNSVVSSPFRSSETRDEREKRIQLAWEKIDSFKWTSKPSS